SLPKCRGRISSTPFAPTSRRADVIGASRVPPTHILRDIAADLLLREMSAGYRSFVLSGVNGTGACCLVDRLREAFASITGYALESRAAERMDDANPGRT